MNYTWARGKGDTKISEIFAHVDPLGGEDSRTSGLVVWPLLPGDWALVGQHLYYSNRSYILVPLKEL